MNEYNKILNQFGLGAESDQKIIFTFFIKFASFENKLIQSGFIKKTKMGWLHGEENCPRIEVGWDLFVSSMQRKFPLRAQEICEKHLSFMTINPPSLLVQRASGQVVWGFTEGEGASTYPTDNGYVFKGPNNLSRLSELLRRIRNNLFHGGKFQDERNVTIDRLTSALTVLNDFEELLGA